MAGVARYNYEEDRRRVMEEIDQRDYFTLKQQQQNSLYQQAIKAGAVIASIPIRQVSFYETADKRLLLLKKL